MCSINWLMLISGSWMSAFRPATTSRRLCGGILVAMPTAIPAAPLTSRCGTLAGSTAGSSCSHHHKCCFEANMRQLCACCQASCVASWCWLGPRICREPLLACRLCRVECSSHLPDAFFHKQCACHPNPSMRAEVLLIVMQQFLRVRSRDKWPTCEASKLGVKSTVSESKSARKVAEEKCCRRHSVYRMAAAGSLSTDPKLPWPSIYRVQSYSVQLPRW